LKRAEGQTGSVGEKAAGKVVRGDINFWWEQSKNEEHIWSPPGDRKPKIVRHEVKGERTSNGGKQQQISRGRGSNDAQEGLAASGKEGDIWETKN